MKNFKGVYSKTYTDQNRRTLIVDNVRYHLGNNNKTMVKMNENPPGSRSMVMSNSAVIAKSFVNKHRILRENNYQYHNIQPNLKRANRSKFELVLKKPGRFKFRRSYSNATKQSSHSTSQYKKTYNTMPKNDQIQQLRRKAVKSSINFLIRKSSDKLKKNNKLKLSTINTTYCMFFCRFGRCAKIDTCKYKHDKDKVAVCKNFLKGKCEVNGCLMSHKIDPKKMPVCSYYLKGICNIENCPYLHVNVSVNAEICKNFARGFCDKGDQCKFLHQYVQSNCRKCNNKKQKCECKKMEKSKNPVLIDLCINSDSNMEISDDDICNDEIVNDDRLDFRGADFIPLFKNSEVNDTPEDGRRSGSSLVNELNDSNSDDPDDPLLFDYDSDDTWFEDDGKNEFFQFIPEFLLN